jgi:hypothetical protein
MEEMFGGGGDDPILDELRKSLTTKMRFDDKNTIDIVRSASKRAGINPSLLFSSAFQEGMNKAVFKPDEVSEAYTTAVSGGGVDEAAYPVDGFYNYGLDRFGDNYKRLKKYLPEGFETRYKPFKAKNEKGEDITTAAFMTNEDALIAKSAMLRDVEDQLLEYAKKKNIKIEDTDKDYFVLASYNGGLGNGKTMLDEYSKSKDKRKFIELGETTRKGVHENISPRLKRMMTISELLNQ